LPGLSCHGLMNMTKDRGRTTSNLGQGGSAAILDRKYEG
jgi:hypothetical protein